ncbi:MAG: prepilin-type N-terminal cleavage/methylation domain-containing protein [Sulfurospirillum sp.]
MKKGFTMIELIFVIVILGILAAVAIPKLAATRDDAKAASIKTDIGTALQALPAWYQGQKEVSFLNAMSLDTNVWSHTSGKCQYVYTDDSNGTVTMSAENNDSSDVGDCSTTPVDANATTQPTLVVTLSAASGNTGIVYTLQNDMGVNDANVSLGGKKVKW